MVNRIIRESFDEDTGRTTTANVYIKQLLVREGEKRFSEIRDYLDEKLPKKYSKKGLILRLEQLQERRIIKKHFVGSKKIPYYYLVNKEIKELEEISLAASSFQIETSDWRRKMTFDTRGSRTQLENNITNLIQRIGLYAIFVLIHSWKLTSKDQGVERNERRRKTWIDHSLLFPLPNEIPIELLLSQIPPPLTNFVLYPTNKESSKKLLQLEKIISEMFPEDIDLLKKAIAKLPSGIRDHKLEV